MNIRNTWLLTGVLFYTNTNAQLPVASEPHHKVILQNDHIRLLDGHIPAHDTTPAHLHAANSIVVFLSRSKFGIKVPGGKPVLSDVNPGDLKYVDYGDKPVTHIVSNESPSMFHFYVVELKPHRPDAPCPTPSQPGLNQQWKQPSVQAWYLDLTAGQSCRLPVSGCARLLIDISGTVTVITPTGSHTGQPSHTLHPANTLQPPHTRQPEGFIYIPPGSDVDIRGNHSHCVLLEIQ